MLKVPPISPTDTVAQAPSPASSGRVPRPGSTPVGTTRQPAAGTAALREEFTLPNVAQIIGKLSGADPLRNAVNQLQSLLYSTAPVAEQTRIVAEVERRLSVVEELEAVVSANSDESRDYVLQRATRLRQSILQKTFTGELLSPNR